ncbi:MAG TPA: TIGR02300 family protein [Rhizomicrobium sp.]
MVKADLGTKRVCPSCGARFYDLTKRPIECPKCAFTFEPEAMYKQHRPRQPEPVPVAQPAAEVEEEEVEEEVEEAEEEAIVEPIPGEPVLETGDDDEEEEAVPEEPEAPAVGISVVEGEDAAIEDIEDADVEEDDEDDGLLEAVEEDEDDVSGIIDADIEKYER